QNMKRHIIRGLLALSVAGLCAAASPISSAYAQTAKDLVGTWRFVGGVSIAANGTKTDAFGSNPDGLQTFMPDGHFVFVIVRGDLPKFASTNRTAGTHDENKAVVAGSLGLFGTYSVRDDTIQMKVEGGTFPNFKGTEQDRTIATLTADELKFTVPL